MGFILMMLMGLWTSTPAEAVEDTLPDVSLHLDDPETEVDVNYGYNGIVNFTGTVYCDTDNIGPNIENVGVILFADSEFPTQISPMGLSFEPYGENTKPFNVSLKVTNFWPANDTIIVTVSAYFRVSPDQVYFEVEPVEEIIKPKPYMCISIFPKYESSTIKTTPGSIVRYTLGINNSGNCMDTFHMGLSNNYSLINDKYRAVDEEWKVVFSTNDFTLKRAEGLEVTVEVSVPDNAPEATYIIIVEVTSEGREGYEESIAVRTWSTAVKVKNEEFLGIGDWLLYVLVGIGLLFVVLGVLIVIWRGKRSK